MQDVVMLINSINELSPTPTPHWVTSLSNIGAAVLGAAAGGIGVFFSTHHIERSKVDRERASILAALQAEVLALMRVVRHRRFPEVISESLSKLEKLKPGSKVRIQSNIREDFSPVYRAHISKVGLLDAKLAGEIVTFYQLAETLAADIRPGCLLAVEGGTVQSFRELETAMRDFFEIGDKIVATKLGR